MHTRIAAVIEHSGLTKTAFAQKLGVSQPHVSMIANGSATPSDRTIADICREFGVSETWLRTGEGEPFPVKPDDVRLAEAAADILSGVAPATRRQFFSLLCSLSDEQLDMAAALLDDMLERWQKQKESDA